MCGIWYDMSSVALAGTWLCHVLLCGQAFKHQDIIGCTLTPFQMQEEQQQALAAKDAENKRLACMVDQLQTRMATLSFFLESNTQDPAAAAAVATAAAESQRYNEEQPYPDDLHMPMAIDPAAAEPSVQPEAKHGS